MSHAATNWAIQQRGLAPSTKMVLWYLADRHNPDHGCFPDQSRLAADCEMSRSSVNNHLRILERLGLIKRIRRVDPKTNQQMSTRYILGFEEEFTQQPSLDFGHGSPVDNLEKPSPNSSESRVQNLDSNLVREPVITTNAHASTREEIPALVTACIEACGPGLSEHARQAIRGSGHVIDEWLAAGFTLAEDILPTLRALTARPKKRTIRTFAYFSGAVADRHYRRDRSPPASRKAEKQPAPFAGGAPGGPGSLAWLAGLINSDSYVPPSMVSNTQRRALLAQGLVTEERLRARHIY